MDLNDNWVKKSKLVRKNFVHLAVNVVMLMFFISILLIQNKNLLLKPTQETCKICMKQVQKQNSKERLIEEKILSKQKLDHNLKSFVN